MHKWILQSFKFYSNDLHSAIDILICSTFIMMRSLMNEIKMKLVEWVYCVFLFIKPFFFLLSFSFYLMLVSLANFFLCFCFNLKLKIDATILKIIIILKMKTLRVLRFGFSEDNYSYNTSILLLSFLFCNSMLLLLISLKYCNGCTCINFNCQLHF